MAKIWIIGGTALTAIAAVAIWGARAAPPSQDLLATAQSEFATKARSALIQRRAGQMPDPQPATQVRLPDAPNATVLALSTMGGSMDNPEIANDAAAEFLKNGRQAQAVMLRTADSIRTAALEAFAVSNQANFAPEASPKESQMAPFAMSQGRASDMPPPETVQADRRQASELAYGSFKKLPGAAPKSHRMPREAQMIRLNRTARNGSPPSLSRSIAIWRANAPAIAAMMNKYM